MKWINDVVFAILAAHVWGSLMLFVWLQAVKRLENKGYTRLLFYLLRAVIVAYLLPLGLGAVLIINEILVLDGRFMYADYACYYNDLSVAIYALDFRLFRKF